MEQIFYCYSNPLKNYLNSQGLKYFSSAIHPKTKKKFWMFVGTEELNNELAIWRSKK